MYDQYIKKLINNKVIPGAVLHIQVKNETKFLKEYGSFMTQEGLIEPIQIDTIFDVASLTKVMATLPSILLLSSTKDINLDHSIKKYVDEFKNENVTIKNLLQHQSGLPADLPYLDRLEPRNVFKEIIETEMINEVGDQMVYSDLGMILLGKLVENVSGLDLKTFTRKNIFDPWGLDKTTYLLSDNKKKMTASTEWYKGSYIQGVVHDEKAFQLGGVSGSAGVFSTCTDVSKFANYWLYPDTQQAIPSDYMTLAISEVQQNRGLGFEVYEGKGKVPSCGHKWSKGSYGHTGFTGTSIWIDPSTELVVVFLTNIVHFGRNHNMNKIRQTLHSLIYSSFIEETNI